jgi:DNA (cytosine-5)-methyltransferase 1
VRSGEVRAKTIHPARVGTSDGFPDNYTLVPFGRELARDGPRYKAVGNSMDVNVMRWLGRRIQIVEETLFG